MNLKRKILTTLIIFLLIFSPVGILAEETVNLEHNGHYYTEYERDILYRIVYAEAGCASDYMQQVVAQVILNRMDSPHFPNTIHDVIFQPYQFSPAPIIYSYPLDARVIANVDYVLYYHTPCPRNVLFFKTTWAGVIFPYPLWNVFEGVEFYTYGE